MLVLMLVAVFGLGSLVIFAAIARDGATRAAFWVLWALAALALSAVFVLQRVPVGEALGIFLFGSFYLVLAPIILGGFIGLFAGMIFSDRRGGG